MKSTVQTITRSIEDFISQKKDNFLVQKTLEGKKEAFAELMTLHQRRVEIMGYSFFHNKADVDDFVQDVFMNTCMRVYTNPDVHGVELCGACAWCASCGG